MTVSNPLDAPRDLEQLYEHGFRDAVTDAALLRVASSQAARDEAVLRDLEPDLSELEQQYQMSSRGQLERQRWDCALSEGLLPRQTDHRLKRFRFRARKAI